MRPQSLPYWSHKAGAGRHRARISTPRPGQAEHKNNRSENTGSYPQLFHNPPFSKYFINSVWRGRLIAQQQKRLWPDARQACMQERQTRPPETGLVE